MQWGRKTALCRSAPHVWAVTGERFSFLKPQAPFFLLEKHHLLLRICSVMTVILGFWDAGADIFERQRDFSHAPPRFARCHSKPKAGNVRASPSTKDNVRSSDRLCFGNSVLFCPEHACCHGNSAIPWHQSGEYTKRHLMIGTESLA